MINNENKPAHTSGPWTNHLQPGLDNTMVHTINKGILRIATISKRGTDENYGTEQANAQLIAAGPELLEALKVIQHRLETGTMPVEPLAVERFNKKIAEAIAKAEGRA